MAPRRAKPRLVTLSSDVGSAYAAQMKAVLVHSVGAGRLVDLAHDLAPHSVREAAFVVRAMAAGFPAGTVHVVVVDPGVGGRRAPIAIEGRDGSVLIGPDNGVLYPLAASLGLRRAVRLDPARLPGPARVGRTFDGRDLFARAAARAARGASLRTLGRPIQPRPAPLPEAKRRGGGASGEVLHVDRFGNVVTNIPSGWLPATARWATLTLGRTARRVRRVETYEALGHRELGVLPSSFGTLELAVDRGRAADRLRLRVGARLRIAPRTSIGK